MAAYPTREACEGLDAADPLAGMRDRFDLPGGVIYLDGNSLGALPRAVVARIDEVVRGQWGRDLIKSWNVHGWIDQPARLGGKIARLIGAQASQVVVADSTSVNLFKLLAGALSLRPGRRVILSEPGNFPTDLYVMQGLERLLGDKVTVRTAPADQIVAAIDEDTAVVSLTHVHYKSGWRHDMAAITRAAHDWGALALWDLSHSVGAVDVQLDGCDADLAVGCGYKYLNGGPGAPAFLYVASRHHAQISNPLSGWMGHAAPFAFSDDYAPAADMRRQLAGTPPIIAMAALEAGLDSFDGVDMPALAAKGAALCDLFIACVEARCPELDLRTPRAADQRGSHVSFAHPQAYGIVQALIARGVIGDFRAPDIARFGFTPLYLRFADVWDAVKVLAEVMAAGEHLDPAYKVRSAVT